MPEGDTIYRTAVTLRDALVDRVIADATSDDPHVDAELLIERRILSVEPRGKHLLVDASGVTIHSHMGMKGAWHVYGREERWQKSRRSAALVLTCENGGEAMLAVCFLPKWLELLSPTALRRHRWLSQLGPDLLASRFDGRACASRMKLHAKRAIGEVLLDQSVICGIGNVYKSEMLFLAGIHPFRQVGDVGDEALVALLESTRQSMLRNLSGYPRRTRFREGPGLWVYDRRGERCLRCGERIERRHQGELPRSSYWCPTCQPPPADFGNPKSVTELSP